MSCEVTRLGIIGERCEITDEASLDRWCSVSQTLFWSFQHLGPGEIASGRDRHAAMKVLLGVVGPGSATLAGWRPVS